MRDPGSIGVWLLVIGAAAIVLEGAVASVWTLRLMRRTTALSARLREQQGEVQADIARLRLALAETEALWQPYARLLRWIRHPLAIALLQSFMRRWAAR